MIFATVLFYFAGVVRKYDDIKDNEHVPVNPVFRFNKKLNEIIFGTDISQRS